jgi:PAS domain S-box-containing protein
MAVVLNVDDQEAARYAGTRVLRQAGFEVLEAGTGHETLVQARRGGVDVIVLDIRLPDMTGREVCRLLKADPHTASIPILHLTATYGAGEDQAAALDEGADAYLTHPVEPIVLVATIRALLRAREAEARALEATGWWQSTFDAISDGVTLLDIEGRILRCNATMARMLGGTPAEMVGRLAVAPLPGAPEPPESWPFSRAVASRQRETSEAKMRDRWFEIVADPVLDERGGVMAVVRTLKDITDRKGAEARVAELLIRERAARVEAEQVNRLKDEFLATLSHELRTPLNAIVGWAHVLRGGDVNEEDQHRAVETIVRNAQLQSQLISDILDVSRIIAGKLRLELQPADLTQVIEQALETVAPAAEAKSVALEVRLDPVAGPTTGDPSRLQQVVWNLLSNAIKFSPENGRVKVTLQPVAAGVELIVQDEGPGIDPTFLPYVFDRFRQADASSSRRHGGLGLGLAIVRHIVELHGGAVKASNRRDGNGAIFEVTLPGRSPAPRVSLPQGRERHPLAVDSPSWMESVPSLAGVRVLVVDDDEDARSLLAYVLARCGAEVLAGASAAEGLSLLTQLRPDVLVADVEMPDEDGYAFLRKVRCLAEPLGSIPAAALTAYASAQDRIDALQAGFQYHIPKPVQPAELASIVASLKSMVVRRG